MALRGVADLFSAFGGTAAFGRVIGRAPSTASEMKRRGSIPVDHWPSLIESDIGHAIGLTADDLLRIHTCEGAPQCSSDLQGAAA